MAPAAIVSDTKLADNVPETNQTAANATTNYLFSLRNKTVLITGGGRGLGITLAAAVVESGGNAACLDILPEPSPEEWGSLQRLAKLSGLRVSYYKCDITQEADLLRVIEQITEEGKRIRAPFAGAIACAGVQQKIPALDYPMEDFSRILHINVTGTFPTAKYAARSFIANNIKGSIIMIASMSGAIANRGLTCTAYNTSKSAVHQMCRSVAQEWGQYGIRVNTLSPGYIRTAMTDDLLANEPEIERTWMQGALLGRLGVPEDFKAPAVFLLASGSSFMTGADLRVDGGLCASA